MWGCGAWGVVLGGVAIRYVQALCHDFVSRISFCPVDSKPAFVYGFVQFPWLCKLYNRHEAHTQHSHPTFNNIFYFYVQEHTYTYVPQPTSPADVRRVSFRSLLCSLNIPGSPK